MSPVCAAKIDPLTATVHELQELLSASSVTSVELVDLYLGQIQKHNYDGLKIRAIIETADRDLLVERARQLDEERQQGKIRSPVHGIPIIVKDNICTPSWAMGTTCGSFALKGAKASKDAVITERLQKAGFLIIGKANLSEWANLKQALMVAGWSAVGGQTQSPYVRGGVTPDAIFLGHSTPCGSSSGSAAGVATGFAPISVGTESDGSLVQPGTRAGLYALKATVGAIPTEGCLASAPWLATSGGLAKSVEDLADLMDILVERTDLRENVKRSWDGLRVGLVDPELWQPAPFVVEPREDFKQQTLDAIKEAVATIKEKGATVKESVPLVQLIEVTKDTGVSEIEQLMRHQARKGFEDFFSLFPDHPIKSIDDVIEFNKKHADLELPPDHPHQDVLINAAKDTMTPEHFQTSSVKVRNNAIEAIQKTLDEYEVDVIMGPADARMASVAAAAGYPVATVPLGYADFNGRAFGMNIIAPAGTEGKILEVMSAWEATFPDARKPPPLLVNWEQQTAANISE